jgi:alpha-glucosidase
MGFKFSDNDTISHKVTIEFVEEINVDSNWKPAYGERNQYPEQFYQAIVLFSSNDLDIPVFKLNIKAYNEGIAFRYEFANAEQTTIEAERTGFTLPVDSKVWVSGSAQGEITKRKIHELNSSVERPLLAELNASLFVALGEAGLIDFARMKFVLDKEKTSTLIASLDSKVVYNGAFTTPWRTIMAGNRAGEILENNYLLLNLN